MRTELQQKNRQAAQRAARVRSNIRGTAERPRLSVYRSNKFYYAQIIDDSAGRTLAAADTKSGGTVEDLGTAIAQKAKTAKVSKVVFDRGGLSYAGNLVKLAEAARSAGLDF